MGTFNGTKGSDTLLGTDSGDTIYGNLGDDFLKGFGGADLLAGGQGVDTAIYADSTVGVVVNLAQGRGYGGSAEGDTLASIENVYGSPYNDTLTGDDQANLLLGLDGNDILKGGGGADTLDGGFDDDTLKGGGGADMLVGGPGVDTANYSMAEVGVTVLLQANVGSFGEAHGDRYSGVENVTGSAYRDHLEGDTSANVLRGLDQDDELYGNYGQDTLDGGAGSDRLYGQRDNDRMIGGPGNDFFYVEDAGDVLVEYGGEGFDRVYTWVNYTLTPGAEIEILYPMSFSDTTAINLTGNEFANEVAGNRGNNVINGGDGSDTLLGIGGRDRFLFDTPLNAARNVDLIADFDQDDTIVLENTIFGAFAAGPLAAERFVVGSAALEANDTIIYNPATGGLFYDVDGSGAGAAVQFARLLIGVSLTENDFVIV
jgi:Ca2+-binding RTX toxin-like protein